MNTASTKKIRVIIRQWTPRKTPYAITHEMISEFIKKQYILFDTVVYAGWARRYSQGHRTISFYIATGISSSEARKRFKESTAFGKEIWELPNQNSTL